MQCSMSEFTYTVAGVTVSMSRLESFGPAPSARQCSQASDTLPEIRMAAHRLTAMCFVIIGGASLYEGGHRCLVDAVTLNQK